MKKIGESLPEFDKENLPEKQPASKPVRIDKNLQKELFPSSHDGIVYNERNIEAISHFLFPHSRAHGIEDVRTLETNDDGAISVHSVRGKWHYTHSVGLTMLACMKWFQEHPRPDGIFSAHFSDICRLRGLNPRNSGNRQKIKKELEALSAVLQEWKYSFDKNGHPVSLRHFSFFTQYGYDGSDKGKSDNFNRKFTAKWHPVIVASLLRGYINPTAYDTLMKIKNDMAGSWFRYIDSKISVSNRKTMNHNSPLVLKILGNTGIRYSKPHNRKQVLETLKKHCHGAKLSSGDLYQIKIKRTADGKDFKLVSWTKKDSFSIPTKPRFKVVNRDKDLVNYLADLIVEVAGEDNNMQWYRKISRHYPQQMIHTAISEFRDATHRKNIAHRGKFFTSVLHGLAHRSGVEWIGKECNELCSLRPENQLDLSV